ncbi:hypothetical protein LZ30DRAFT_739268 [Colletotrichum cereale]|nr:hypothetical protein LZ30DRAFT_739268 [Colletotrichum cereale]
MLGDTALHLLAGPIHRFASPKPSTQGTEKPAQGHKQRLETESLDLLGYILRCMHAHKKCKGSAALINIVNNYGNTALVVAILYDNKEAARLLLEGGADPRIRGELNTCLGTEWETVDTVKEYTDFGHANQ